MKPLQIQKLKKLIQNIQQTFKLYIQLQLDCYQQKNILHNIYFKFLTKPQIFQQNVYLNNQPKHFIDNNGKSFILSIKKYLKQNKLQQSWLAIEKQTNIKLYNYPKEIQFLRKLILTGNFNQVIKYLTTIQPYLNQQQQKTSFLTIYRQWLYQLIQQPNQMILRNIFEKQLVEMCDQQQYQRLFGMLTCRRVRDLQGLSQWTVVNGRVKAFEQVVKIIENVLGYGNTKSEINNGFRQDGQQINDINLDEAMALYNQVKKNNQSALMINQNIPQTFPSNSLSNSKLHQFTINPSQLISNNNKQKQLPQQKINNKSNIRKDITIEQNNISSYGLRSMMYGREQVDNNNNSQANSKIKDNNNNRQQDDEIVYGNNLNPTGQFSQVFANKNDSDVKNIRRSQVASYGNIVNYNKNNNSTITTNKNQSHLNPNQQSQQPHHQLTINKPKHSPNKQQQQQLSTRKQQIDNFYNNNSKIQHNQQKFIQQQQIRNNNSYQHQQFVEQSQSSYQYQHQQYQFQQQPYQKSQVQQPQPHIQYLQQTNSIVYNNNQQQKSHQNFTFSQHHFIQQPMNSALQQQQKTKSKIIKKLASTSDPKAIRTCQFSSSGQYFALGTNSSVLKIFSTTRLYQQNKFNHIKPIYQINNLHTKSIFCLDWAQDEQSIVTCSNDLTVKLTQFSPQFDSHNVSVIGRHQSCIRMVKYSHDQHKIFSCGDDGLIKVWDMGKVKRCYNLKGHNAGINAFKLCQDTNQLYSVSKDATIKRWDLRSLQCIATSKSHQSQITYIASNTQKIVVSNKNGNVSFYDSDLNLQYEVKIHEQQIRSIEARKNEDLHITASFDGHVGLFGQKSAHEPDYFQHNENSQDKVVFATFLNHPQYKGFASTSTLGLCHIYSYQ